MNQLYREHSILNLKEFNQSRLIASDILTGKEYRRQRRKKNKTSFEYLLKDFR